MRRERNVLTRGVRQTLLQHAEDDNTQPQILITADVSILLWRAQRSFWLFPYQQVQLGFWEEIK